MINQILLMMLEHNASQLRNPIERSVAIEMVWSVRRQRAYQVAIIEAHKLIKANDDLSKEQLLIWLNERVELAHTQQEGLDLN